jgi:hypothetical protein
MSVADLVGTVSGNFGTRFGIVAILPSITLFILLFGLIFSYSETPSVVPNIDTLISKLKSLDLLESVFVFITIIVFSVIVHPLQLQIVRVFEGYWSEHKVIQPITKIGKRIQEYKRRQLAEGSKLELRQHYPDEGGLLPTSLGNVLRAAENIAGRRYGFGTATMWPRLYPLVSADLRSILDDQRNQMDAAVSFCVVFSIFTISSFVYYLATVYAASMTDFPINFILENSTPSHDPFLNFYLIVNLAIKYSLWLVIPLFSALLAWLSYIGAISVALAYGKSIQVAFDFHRFDILKALHLPLPNNLLEEKEANYDLSDFFALGQISNSLKNITYSHSNEDVNNNKEKKTGAPFP